MPVVVVDHGTSTISIHLHFILSYMVILSPAPWNQLQVQSWDWVQEVDQVFIKINKNMKAAICAIIKFFSQIVQSCFNQL